MAYILTVAKISIVVPSRDGMPYLADCVSSILAQNMKNLELIVSLNESHDESLSWLKSISDVRLRVLQSPYRMSMSAHWDFALRYATGDWILVMGDDDGLMPWFSEVANHILRKSLSADIITWRPGTFFWPGYPGKRSIDALALGRGKVKKISVRVNGWLCLLGIKRFNNLPMIYQKGLWARNILRDLLEDAPVAFRDLAPDIYTGVFASLRGASCHHVNAPLSWTGLSLKSNSVTRLQPDGESGLNFAQEASEIGITVPKTIGQDCYDLGYSSIIVLSAYLNMQDSSKRITWVTLLAFGGALAESFIKNKRTGQTLCPDWTLFESPFFHVNSYAKRAAVVGVAWLLLPILAGRSALVRIERLGLKLFSQRLIEGWYFFQTPSNQGMSLLEMNRSMPQLISELRVSDS